MKKNLLAAVAGLLLSGCSGHGAEGIPAPAPIDFAHLNRPSTPNTALAAPAGFQPKPDIVTRAYGLPPAALYAAVKVMALHRERTTLHAAFDDRLQAHYVVRSRIMNFPDLVTVQVQDDGTLILWSRSVYGAGDMGVNRARVAAWLAALDAALGS